jgi:DNA-binding CsgD family transcriptional regulator
MALLTNADVKGILKFLQELLVPCTVETLPEQIFSALPKLVPSELTSWTVTSFQKREIVAGWTSVDDVDQYFRVANQHMDEHPFTQHYFQTRDGKARSLSDFISREQLYRLEGLYQQTLRPLGMEEQIVTVLPTPSNANNCKSLLQSQGEAVVMAILRSQQDFSERDRLIINLLRPHLAQAFQNAQAFTQIQQSLAQLNHTIEQLAAIAVATDGQVRHMTKRAWELLVQYFHPTSLQSQCLPDNLQRWLNYQIALISQTESLTAPCFPLTVEQEGQQLVIRLIVDQAGEQYLLLLEEEQIAPLSAASLELIGLTKREAEVLFWVTHDKSDAEIAAILNVSRGTVKKHLEHIYQKLNVHTRIAATMYALRSLGRLK